MKARIEYLKDKIQLLQRQINSMPDGEIICAKNGKGSKWYIKNDRELRYLPKNQRELAENLAIKKYLNIQLQELLQEQKATDSYLKKFNPSNQKLDKLLDENSAYSELLQSHFTSESQKASKWIETSYENNTKYPEHLIHRTASGHLVRSKSEAMIDMVLSVNGIPFRYECALELGEIKLFPDFTIYHPATGKIYYWEHFGMMDNRKYVNDVNEKMRVYTSNGLIPSINLITTYETKENPLNTETVERIVQYYFL